jgi:hypothetical protein
MTPKRNASHSTIHTGGGAYVGGNVNTGGGNFIGRDQFNQTFQPIYDHIEKTPLPAPVKEDLKAEVKELQEHIQAHAAPDEGFLARHMRNIRRMAPDILDVILKSLAGPQAAALAVVQKIAARIQSEKA